MWKMNTWFSLLNQRTSRMNKQLSHPNENTTTGGSLILSFFYVCGESTSTISPCVLGRQSSSIWLTTSVIEGRLSGYCWVQSTASCNRRTISSSTFWYRRSSRSNTSAVHSSRTTDWTHLGRSTPSSFVTEWVGALPVSNSNSKTPKLYTSAFCEILRGSVTSGAR